MFSVGSRSLNSTGVAFLFVLYLGIFNRSKSYVKIKTHQSAYLWTTLVIIHVGIIRAIKKLQELNNTTYMYKYIKLNTILAKTCIDNTMFAYVLLNYIVVINTMMWLNRKIICKCIYCSALHTRQIPHSKIWHNLLEVETHGKMNSKPNKLVNCYTTN